jgi:hypothetical protein
LTEIIKETVTTSSDSSSVQSTPVGDKMTGTQTSGRVVYYLFGVLEVLLAFRLIFKLAGASQGSALVSFIYRITRIFIMPFEGIFRRGVSQGVETASVLEPSTIVALIVYILLAWGIVKLLSVLSGEKEKAD